MIDEAAVRALLRAKVTQYKTITEAANAWHINRNQLYRILGGRASPGIRLLKLVGIKRVLTRTITYVPMA